MHVGALKSQMVAHEMAMAMNKKGTTGCTFGYSSGRVFFVIAVAFFGYKKTAVTIAKEDIWITSGLLIFVLVIGVFFLLFFGAWGVGWARETGTSCQIGVLTRKQCIFNPKRLWCPTFDIYPFKGSWCPNTTKCSIWEHFGLYGSFRAPKSTVSGLKRHIFRRYLQGT